MSLKYLNRSIGRINTSLNLRESENDLIINIPLMTTRGKLPINLGLNYSFKNRNNVDNSYGNGFVLNYYKEIESQSAGLFTLRGFDGKEYVYRDDEVNIITQLKVCDYQEEYNIIDKYGNASYHSHSSNHLTSSNYPFKITTSNDKEINFELSTDNKKVLTIISEDDTIYFYYSGNKYWLEYIYDNNVQEKVELTKNTNGNLESIKVYQMNTLVEEYIISYTENTIQIKDNISTNNIIYVYDGDMFEIIDERVGETTIVKELIEYYNNRTHITSLVDEEENEIVNTIVFSDDGNKIYLIDEFKNVVGEEYDSSGLRKKKDIEPFNLNDTTGNLFSSSVIENDSGLNMNQAHNDYEFFGDVLDGFCYIQSYNSGGYYTLEKQVNGLANQPITLNLFGCYISKTGGECTVTLEVGDEIVSQKLSNNSYGNYELICLGITPKTSYSNIKVRFDFDGECECEINNLMVSKRNYGTIYTYDQNTKNLLEVDSNGSINKLFYNENNQLIQNISSIGSGLSYKLDDNKVTKITQDYGVYLTRQYDECDNVTMDVVNNLLGQTITTKYEYTHNNELLTKSDAFNNKIEYSYDYFYKDLVNKVVTPDAKVVKYEYESAKLKNIIVCNSAENEVNRISLQYDSRNRLYKITLSTGLIYTYEYDAYNNVKKVKLNNQTLVTYDYLIDGKLFKKTYGNGNDGYRFEYNIYNQLIKVYDIKTPETLKYQYTYDVRGRLNSIKNCQTNEVESYDYDMNGNITGVINSNLDISYDIDNNGVINFVKREVEDNMLITSLDTLERSRSTNPDAILNTIRTNDKYYSTIFRNGDEKIVSKENTIYPINIDNQTICSFGKIYKGIPVLDCNYKNGTHKVLPSYKLESDNSIIRESGSVGFWFYPKSFDSTFETTLFNVCKAFLDDLNFYEDDYSIRIAMDGNGEISLKTHLKGEKEEITQLTFECGSIKLYEWNFIGLSFKETLIRTNFLMNVNGIFKQKLAVGTFQFGDCPKYSFGYQNVDDNVIGLERGTLDGYITCLMIGKRCSIEKNEMLDYYVNTKDFIMENISTTTDYNIVDFGSSRLYTGGSVFLLNNEVFSLNNTLKSFNYLEPKAYDKKGISNVERNKTFVFDRKLKRYVYSAVGSRLEFDTNLSQSGTILVHAITSDIKTKRYIFELKDENDQKIGLYIGEDDYLYLSYNGITKTNLQFTPNVWHRVGLSFSTITTSDSDTTTDSYNFKIFLSGHPVYMKTFTGGLVGSFDLSLGRQFVEEYVSNDSFGEYYTNYPLMGKMEMLVYNRYDSSESNFIILSEQLKVTSSVNCYDELGLLRVKEINQDETNIIKQELAYSVENVDVDGQNTKELRPRVTSEILFKDDFPNYIQTYVYDNVGRIVGVGKAYLFEESDADIYEYDVQGRLSKVNDSPITYDKFGNILSKDGKSYVYDQTYKNRLNSYNGNSLTYDTNDPYKLKAYDNMSFTFEGNRLVKVLKEYYDEENEITYEYNARGQRTKKTIYYSYFDDRNSYEEEYKYYYDGDLLITEIAPSYRNDFLYDENGELYGLIYKNHASETSYTHYYVRDILKNIIGLVDSNGNLVVKYTQDVWGYQQSIDDDSMLPIGQRNPFRYKGYYYDVETGLFMVGHRYYNPEWGRWIQQDDIEYLDPTNINGLNLYAYCNNDPVNYFDPDGHMAISTIVLLLCIGVGALVGGTYAGVTAYNDGARGWELVGWTALGAVVGGAVGGLVGYYAGPMAASLFGSGGGFMFAGGLGTAGIAISGTLAGTLVTAGAVGLTAVGALAANNVMTMSRPNSGRIRFSDGTGIDPETGKPVTSKERAYEIYRSLKDPIEKAKWRQWMKGKGWRISHLK